MVTTTKITIKRPIQLKIVKFAETAGAKDFDNKHDSIVQY